MLCKLILISVTCLLIKSLSASDVIDLKDSNFDNEIRHHDVALVEFFAPWCGHCKRIAPEYEIAATQLKRDDNPVALIKVDCTVETKVCAKYGVSGYPTLKIFKSGEMSSDYEGPREADGIVKFMRTKAGPTSKELLTIGAADKFLESSEHSIVGFFKSGSSELASEFKKVADQLADKFRFAYSSEPSVLEKFGHEDKVVVYQPKRLQVKLLPTENVYTGDGKSSGIKEFIETELHGLVGHRTLANIQQFKGPLVVVNYQVDYIRDIKGSNYVRNRVIKVAQKLLKEGVVVNFAISSADEFKAELAEFGFDHTIDNQKHILARGPNAEKFKFNGEYSVENLEQFARDISAGSVEQYLKSEPLPEANDEAVLTVVAKNFNEIVNDESKDVLIEFYAPWCGHCKSLAPVFEEVAQKLKSESGIVLAKMDATMNDVPANFGVQGFPTLFFVKKGEKQTPMKYEGGRDVESFVNFLAKEATQPLGSFDRKGKKTTKSEL